MALKVKWIDYISGMYGTVTKNQYIRRIPGNSEWALLCKRPEYSDKKKKNMAKREAAVCFKDVQATASREYRENRAYWEKKWKEAIQKEKRHPHAADINGKARVSPILWQYVKQEIYKQWKKEHEA